MNIWKKYIDKESIFVTNYLHHIYTGLGDNVVIEGNEATGDVLIDTNGDFLLQNLTIRPSKGQVGIAHHKGNIKLIDIHLEGKLWYIFH